MFQTATAEATASPVTFGACIPIFVLPITTREVLSQRYGATDWRKVEPGVRNILILKDVYSTSLTLSLSSKSCGGKLCFATSCRIGTAASFGVWNRYVWKFSQLWSGGNWKSLIFWVDKRKHRNLLIMMCLLNHMGYGRPHWEHWSVREFATASKGSNENNQDVFKDNIRRC